MNKECIIQSIKELDDSKEINFNFLFGDFQVVIELNDIFIIKICYIKKVTIECFSTSENGDILYAEYGDEIIDNSKTYFLVTNFFNKNKEKLKQIVKENYGV